LAFDFPSGIVDVILFGFEERDTVDVGGGD
jgi:hypothetical protein